MFAMRAGSRSFGVVNVQGSQMKSRVVWVAQGSHRRLPGALRRSLITLRGASLVSGYRLGGYYMRLHSSAGPEAGDVIRLTGCLNAVKGGLSAALGSRKLRKVLN